MDVGNSSLGCCRGLSRQDGRVGREGGRLRGSSARGLREATNDPPPPGADTAAVLLPLKIASPAFD